MGDVSERLEPETDQGRLDRDEAQDLVRVRGGEAEPRPAAGVLARKWTGPAPRWRTRWCRSSAAVAWS